MDKESSRERVAWNVRKGDCHGFDITRENGRVFDGTAVLRSLRAPRPVLDTMATVAAISGAQMPPETVSAENSVNVLGAWLGTAKGPVRKAMIVNSEDGVFAVRQGPWKWIEGKPDPERRFPNKFGRRKEFKPQLYNLQDDPAETKNLISQHPELVQEFSRLGHWLKV